MFGVVGTTALGRPQNKNGRPYNRLCEILNRLLQNGQVFRYGNLDSTTIVSEMKMIICVYGNTSTKPLPNGRRTSIFAVLDIRRVQVAKAKNRIRI